jgi:DNA modification methylase
MSEILTGDALETLRTLRAESVNTCVTSPPYYGLRDYGAAGQIGLERTPDEYIARLTAVFWEVRRVLKDDGTLWVIIGDCYAGKKGSASHPESAAGYKQATNKGIIGQAAVNDVTFGGLKQKNIVGIPFRLAFALQADGWYLRQDIIWAKLNPMPESVTDRCVKSHEYIFLLSKSPRYYFDHEAIREPAADSKRNKRDVWTVGTKPYKGEHFATFPVELITPCILAGSREGGVVLDPFAGSGTVGVAAARSGREYILIDINAGYAEMARKRIEEDGLRYEV